MKKIAAVILAAGQGTRMRSDLPKVLHRVAGRSLVSFPVDLAARLGCDPIVLVTGHGRELVEKEVRACCDSDKVVFALQPTQKGTGHAVMSALPKLRGHRGAILVLSGDVPLLDRASITKLKKAYSKTGGPLAFLSFRPENPAGYGRVLRENGVVAIREDKDCTRMEKAITEVNAGIYLIDIGFLRKAVKKLSDNNSQGELYLTDLVEAAAKISSAAAATVATDMVSGVNDRVDLARIDATLAKRIRVALMRSGVTIRMPETVRIDKDVKVGRDTEIDPGVQLLGNTKIGNGCRIETGAVVRNSTVHAGAVINAYSVLDDAEVKTGAEIGPMGRLRPGAIIGKDAKVGNFVELKNTTLGNGSKANHLAYLGDGDIGEGVNVGAGTIFCNYDGYQKHKTVLEDDVFIGSDSQLVAPVTVGRGSYVASGSTVTKDIPPDTLAIARSPQENKVGIARALRRRFKALKEKALKEKALCKKKKGEKS
ncbi:MAG: UDP-N-acetylglucosamine diphosphorylase/glucosamine-1-phosphate N-acetyltransferase [Deltaproteobacteria bacterium]|nr:UDP-N-acetylglucosamine diphosphorylase/glucosamine-1-phosphate N-acetyltransferase [Deltaproteobacteria bacterium]